MTLQNFITRLNWRQILIHSVAFWFFIYAFQTLSYLHDAKLMDAMKLSNTQDAINGLTDNGMTSSELANLQLWTGISGQAGLLVALIISVTISIKRHWFWINSFIAFIVIYFLYKFDLLGWTYLRNIFWYLGQRFNNSTTEFLFNGIVLLVIGLLILFLKGPNRFIENKDLAAV